MKIKNLISTSEKKPSFIHAKRVSVREHRVHDEMWDELHEITKDRILELRSHPGNWCIYLNPAFTVGGSDFSPEFSREARKCQGVWISRMNKTLTKRCLFQLSDYMTRQLARNGVLIINGHLIAPHDWKAMEAEFDLL